MRPCAASQAAIASGAELVSIAGGRLALAEGRFSELDSIAQAYGIAAADGVVLDVGATIGADGGVERLLAATLGDAYNPAAVQPVCPCTDLGHDDVAILKMECG